MIKMRKFLLITVLMLILYTVSVNATFDIIEPSVELEGTVGQTLFSSFDVKNTGSKNLNISFTISTLTNETDQLTLNSFDNITDLAPDTIYIANFSVTIPDQQRAGLYTGTLTALSGSLSDTLTIKVDVAPTFSVSVVSESELGSASLNTTKTSTFDITNTGNDDLTNVKFEFTDTNFNLQTNKTDFILAFNTTETIEFNITIPSDYSTGNVTLGSVKLISTEISSQTLFSLKASIGGGLEIEDLDVFLTTRDSKSESHLDIIDGKTLDFGEEEAGPGSELIFNLEIENTFTDDENIDIEDVTVRITIEEMDDGQDIEEESEEFEIESGIDEGAEVIVNIPLSVVARTYTVLIDVFGEDESGNEHSTQIRLKLRIKKEPRDVVVTKASLFPGKIKCVGSATLTATIKNLGSRLESEAMIEILNSDLGVDFVKQNIELEEDPFDDDNEFTKKLTVNVGENIEAGTYPIKINSYLRGGILWDSKTAKLVVGACTTVEEVVEEEAQEEEIIEEETVEEVVEVVGEEQKEEVTEGVKVPVLKPTTSTEIPLTNRSGFWAVVFFFNLVIIFVVFYFVFKAADK